jgi:tetratricopeptide (TPR) repeat protein
MKALIINSQGHTDEAFALAKVALKNDMKSHICWHVYGLLYRSVKNFEESIKAYKFALKLEPGANQIQRDLALLQMQMRDYQGYIQSRRAILTARSGLRQNWTALAIAQHLAGDLIDAERTLSAFEETIRTTPPKFDHEHSEAALYKNTIIAEMGETERALDHLDAISKNNLDPTAAMEMRAQYLLQLGRKEEAEKAYRGLLERNAELRAYYEGLQTALGLESSDVEPLKKLYAEYAEKNPRGDAAKRMPLDFLEGDEFREAADKYLRHMLRKGVPSTFANVKFLYSDEAKRNTILELVEGYMTEMSTSQPNGSIKHLPNGEDQHPEKQDSQSQSKENVKVDGEKPSPVKHNNDDESSLFAPSVRYFLAQHYNYHRSRDLDKAMRLIDEAVASQPDSVDLHMTKARIWKHYGDTQKASETMEKARTVDERDRYINTKAAKYRLRNDENEAALQTMSKFTRNEAVGGPLGDLHEMQCVWFILEEGDSYIRQGKLGLALKRFSAINDIFEIWQEDQFDFHTFSLRKGQIRAYIDMVRWEDQLREHPFFSRAAIAAAKTYVLLYDNPHLSKESLTNGVNGDGAHGDKAERKRAQKKARKEREKKEQEEAEKKDAKKTAGVSVDGDVKKEDPDPTGQKLLQTSDPLGDAMKFVAPLLEYSPESVEAQQAGFEVFLRRRTCPNMSTDDDDDLLIVSAEKYLLALRCLLSSYSIDNANPVVHEQLLRFRHVVSSLPEQLPTNISEIIESELSPILPKDANLSKLNEDFLGPDPPSLAHAQAAVRVRRVMTPDRLDQDQKSLLALLEIDNATLQDAMNGLRMLKEWQTKPEAIGEYVEKARSRWPKATVFQSKG